MMPSEAFPSHTEKEQGNGTLASHLAQVWGQNSNSIPTAGMLHDYSILWAGDPFSCSKGLPW
jgi:hypothetical protein